MAVTVSVCGPRVGVKGQGEGNGLSVRLAAARAVR